MTNHRADATGAATASRETVLADIFVALADTLVEDYDSVDLLDRLVHACVELVGASEAGILLDDQAGTLSVVASTSESTRLLEVFQVQSDEGPCLECVRTGQPVVSEDLHAETERWSLFAPAALAAGMGAVVALPMRLREQRIGGLNLFYSESRFLSSDDQRLAQALADIATIGILHRRSTLRVQVVAEQLQHALRSRVVIEQAKGVLAERGGLDMEAAFVALRSYSRDHNLRLTDLARAVVQGEVDLTDAS